MRLSGTRARHAQPISTGNLLRGAEPWDNQVAKKQRWRDAAEENIVKFAIRTWWRPNVSCLTTSPWSREAPEEKKKK
jgi:hypothetical protein